MSKKRPSFRKFKILTWIRKILSPSEAKYPARPKLTKIPRHSMNLLLLGKRWPHKSWKMAKPDFWHWIVPIIISGQGKMVCWLVGAKCVVPDHPRSTLDSPRHFQTSKGTNTNNFPVNQNHPRRPQTPLTEPQKIQDFQLFGNRSSDYDPPRVNWQLQLLTFLTKIVRYYMD